LLEILTNLVTFSLMPVSGFFVVKNLSNTNERIYTIKNFIFMCLLILSGFLIYNVKYEYAITILNFCSITIAYKFIFKLNFFNSFFLSLILMIFVFVSDIIVYLCSRVLFFDTYIRDVGIAMIISNLLVGLFCILLSRNKFIKKIISKLLNKFNSENKFQTIILSVLWMFIISLLCYTIFNASINSIDFWVSIFVELGFIVFIINYLRDKNRYIALNERFDDIYEYIQTMEEYIDNEQTNIHEYKNQLSVIRSMSKNKKIQDYIDSLITKEKTTLEYSSELKKLPKGGLKGLLYYKLAQAWERKLNVVVSVSDNVGKMFSKMSLLDTKELSRLLGIYFDNAMEAAVETSKKNVSLEIYKANEDINIVISNSISNTINLKDIYKKGYTSKGKGRGHGLYLAQKLIDKNEKIEATNKIVNNYYIQKIVIKQK